VHPLVILAIAIAIVLLGILVLRLHAFLALLLAALSVALLTPTANVERTELQKKQLSILSSESGEIRVALSPGKSYEGERFALVRSTGGAWQQIAILKVDRFVETAEVDGRMQDAAVLQPVELGDDAEPPTIGPGDMVVRLHDFAAAKSAGAVTAPQVVATGFGATCKSIGLLIAMASIIGKCLLDCGAADRIVRSALSLVGQRMAPAAFVASGFVLGIPVFFDTVFYLMIPLGKAMRLRTGKNYLLYILTIVAGGTMAHSLVPPTPGPLLVAEELGVNLLTMICAGCIIGSFAALWGYLFALWINRRMEIPLTDGEDMSLAELEKLSQVDESQLPPVWLALLPIILPVLLIAGGTAIDSYLEQSANPAAWVVSMAPLFQVLGDKNIALVIAAAIALATLAWTKRTTLLELNRSVQLALASGGVIILITGAGGAFGAAVRQSGVADEIAQLTSGLPPLWVLPVAFVVTTMIRTAQGSATVAMITAVSVLDHFAEPGLLPFHPVYLAMAIGCGSKPIAWMADSGFWVICKMSGMTEAQGLQTITPLSVVMGVSGLFATLIGAWLFPLQ